MEIDIWVNVFNELKFEIVGDFVTSKNDNQLVFKRGSVVYTIFFNYHSGDVLSLYNGDKVGISCIKEEFKNKNKAIFRKFILGNLI